MFHHYQDLLQVHTYNYNGPIKEGDTITKGTSTYTWYEADADHTVAGWYDNTNALKSGIGLGT